MTQTGKCDTCRLRKVKCDEERPKCGACRKKDRPCIYSYGKASAFVAQDPNQLTKHGKSKTASVVWSLDSSPNDVASSESTPSDLQIMSGRPAGDGRGYFQTLAARSKPKYQPSKKRASHQKRLFQAHLRELQEESALNTIHPSSQETSLIARYINMLGTESPDRQPLSILGTWVQSIPSRIGKSTLLDLAVQFLVDSYTVYQDDTHSKRKLARATKAKALRELQMVVLDTSNSPTYEVLLATKMHYAAEALLGIDSMYHAIHAFGLAEQLKSGSVSDVDHEHYWDLIDNTYIDDVNEAILAGRPSVYDNDFYLSATYPPSLTYDLSHLSPAQRASMAIMHVFIQCPRLVCIIRNAISNPSDTDALACAVSHMESIMELELSQHVQELIETSVRVVPVAHIADMEDIICSVLEFSSVQSMILCTRYWMLQNVLCGMADTLYRYFPTEMSLSTIPGRDHLCAIDTSAALNLAKSLGWADSTSQKLPLVKLRLHTPLQISIGPWHRTIRRLTSPNTSLEPAHEAQLLRAQRMKSWLVAECNKIHLQWNVSAVDEEPLLEALDTMAGERIPDWLPTRVRFAAEDGELVMKLDYANRTGTYAASIHLTERDKAAQHAHRGTSPFEQGQAWQRRNVHVHALPLRPSPPPPPPPSWHQTMRPADFIHGTGRNLCSTAGWWPESETTSTVLLDSTHKASAFSSLARPRPQPRGALLMEGRSGDNGTSEPFVSDVEVVVAAGCDDGEWLVGAHR
ncbi:hypothetical protein ACN47E_004951 [Coniothyrium glycines]